MAAPLFQKRSFWLAGILFVALFAVLMAYRLDWIQNTQKPPITPEINPHPAFHNRDSWMNVFQNDRKIGYIHSEWTMTQGKYKVDETVFMKINTLGVIQELRMNVTSVLNRDFSLSDIDFNVDSKLFTFSAVGQVKENMISLVLRTGEDARTLDIPLKNKPYVMAGLIDAVNTHDPEPGETFQFDIFDPATTGTVPVTVTVVGAEKIDIMDNTVEATRLDMSMKGSNQSAWIDESGEILKESGLMGITLIKTSEEDALFGRTIDPSQDLTEVIAVPANIVIDAPASRNHLEILVENIDTAFVDLGGGRQRLEGNTLIIDKEILPEKPAYGVDEAHITEKVSESLKPTPFIQSDHPRIVTLVDSIVSQGDPVLVKAEKIMEWISRNIDKEPVVSVPDALATLDKRIGDCNEHAVLFAAMARAVGIPTDIEIGLVYLEGRFYYHAWNTIFADQWITLDSVFNQIPADVTHIRFAAGNPEQQLDILSVIGKVKLTILDMK